MIVYKNVINWYSTVPIKTTFCASVRVTAPQVIDYVENFGYEKMNDEMERGAGQAVSRELSLNQNLDEAG